MQGVIFVLDIAIGQMETEVSIKILSRLKKRNVSRRRLLWGLLRLREGPPGHTGGSSPTADRGLGETGRERLTSLSM